MQVPQGIHNRVARLLRGEATSPDLDRIFLWLRENPYGRRAVKDIGDFVAHWAKRDAGVSCQHARDIYDTMEIHIAVAFHGEASVEIVGRGMRAAYSLDDPSLLKSETGIGYSKMKKVVESTISKMVYFDVTQKVVRGNFSPEEKKAITRYVGRLQMDAVFTDQDLARELSELLVKFEVISVQLVPTLLQQTELLGAYAVSKMHKSRIVSERGRPIDLVLAHDMGPPTGGLGIKAQRAVRVAMDGRVAADLFYGIPLFTTRCKATDWCPDLTEEDTSVELELVGRRLIPVR